MYILFKGKVLKEPPKFEAYREYIEGSEAFFRGEFPEAVDHFLRAAERLTLIADQTNGEETWEVEAERETKLYLKTAARPGTVLLDGASARSAFDAETHLLTLALPPGHHKITMR